MAVQGYQYIENHHCKRSTRSYHPYGIEYYDTTRTPHLVVPQLTPYYNKGACPPQPAPPAQNNNSNNTNNYNQETTICKLASARERDRTNNVNSAFVTLRTLIPTDPIDRKLSKIETLRLASSYISHLQTVLTVGLEPAQQPCMKRERYMRRMMGKHEEDQPTAICTFCLSGAKGIRGSNSSSTSGGGCGSASTTTTAAVTSGSSLSGVCSTRVVEGITTAVGDNTRPSQQGDTSTLQSGAFEGTGQYQLCNGY